MNDTGAGEGERYAGCGVRVGDSPVVHEVRWYQAPGGALNLVAGPRCGAGGVNWQRLSPARSGRMCARCGRMQGGAPRSAGATQSTLF